MGRVKSGHIQTMRGKEQVCFNRTVLSSDGPKPIATMALGVSQCCQSPKNGFQELQLDSAVKL